MTATETKWAGRIAEWHESGLTSEQFSEGRDFSANGLRHWAFKLGKTKRRRRQAEVPIARVVRVPAESAAKTIAGATVPVDSSLVVEIGGARVVVQPGFDRETLALLVEVLAARGEAQ